MSRGPFRHDGADGASLAFTFDGKSYAARPGDTLAAALLANGVSLIGRSFKYHRPRGILSAGVEEPSALVTVGQGARATPNTRATDVFVYDGLAATSQNCWPSPRRDVGAALSLLSPVFAAGFYYKTFFGPARQWMIYEHLIRRAAGLGRAPVQADPDHYTHRAAFCDVLVLGGGHAGLIEATRAAEHDQRVILVEQDAVLGAGLLREGEDPAPTIAKARAVIEAHGGRILTRTTASALWDHGSVTLAQHCVEAGQAPTHGGPAQRLWQVRAGKIVLATGAIERPQTFAGNDLPGVMLARAVRDYIARYKVLPGHRAVIVTNNDDAYATARAIIAAGGTVAAMLDTRPAPGPVLGLACPVHSGAAIRAVKGGARGVACVIANVDGREMRLDADLVAMSGGFTPSVHLHSQGAGKLVWREDIGAYVPGASLQNIIAVGAAAGDVPAAPTPPAPSHAPKKAFIDFQNDVTAADVALAWQEGYRSVEHLKRYTTLGMATDQGKTSNLVAIAQLASAGEVSVPEAGLTTYRAPYTPLTLGAMAGEHGGGHVAPRRRLAIAARHEALAPLWYPLGYWHRPAAYPRGSETLAKAARREALAVRTSAGLTDVSTLAKFTIAGPDAAQLLERVCATSVAKLKVGRGRYTFMLRDDGMVYDDGTVWRVSENEYLLTSSTGGAERMESQLRYVHQVLAPHWRCSIFAQQEHWAGFALAGPAARAVLATLTGAAPPAHMGTNMATIAAVQVRLLGASYSGERAFEIYATAPDAGPVWDALFAATQSVGGAPYGLEAMELLRIEKGHVLVGGEIDGRTTPHDLRLEKMLNPAGGYIGASALSRPALAAPDRLQLVGLVADGQIPEGAMLIEKPGGPAVGHVTSAGQRLLGEKGAVAMGLLTGGRLRDGAALIATSPSRGRSAQVTVCAPHFHDPQGARYRD